MVPQERGKASGRHLDAEIRAPTVGRSVRIDERDGETEQRD